MTEIQISLPDQLAGELQSAGLLDPERMETMLREQLRQQHIRELFEAMDRMAAVPDPPPMTPEEIQVEIDAVRAERRAENNAA